MKWILVNAYNGSHFWTLQQSEIKAELRYNQEAQSIRLHADDKRLFFLEKTGMLQSKILLRTEYSVTAAETYLDKNRLSGIMILNENKFSFLISGDQLRFYDRKKQLILEITIENVGQLELMEFSALLFGSALIGTRSKIEKEMVAA